MDDPDATLGNASPASHLTLLLDNPPASTGNPSSDTPAQPTNDIAADEPSSPPVAVSEMVPAPAEDEPLAADPLVLPSPGPSLSSPPEDSHEEPATGPSHVRWDESAADEPPAEDTFGRSGEPAAGLCDELADLADPLVYDATRAAVGAVLGRTAELLRSGALPQLSAACPAALSAAADLLRHVLSAARRHVETAAGAAHRLLPLGVRLAEHVVTVPQWRGVQARSLRCARRAIYRALLELQLPPVEREARRLLRRLRRRPARLWADITLQEAAAALACRRPPDTYPGCDAELDAARQAETALLAAYRAAVRACLSEPVPAAPPPQAQGLDRAGCVAAVHDVVRTWRYSVRWRYCVDFLRAEEERLLTRHVFQVRFSIPEPHQPIPRPVAYVFFVLTVSNVKPASEPVQMFYMLETSRLRHVPGKVIFQEKWLIDIINVKLKFWREIKF